MGMQCPKGQKRLNSPLRQIKILGQTHRKTCDSLSSQVSTIRKNALYLVNCLMVSTNRKNTLYLVNCLNERINAVKIFYKKIFKIFIIAIFSTEAKNEVHWCTDNIGTSFSNSIRNSRRH